MVSNVRSVSAVLAVEMMPGNSGSARLASEGVLFKYAWGLKQTVAVSILGHRTQEE